MKRSRLAAAATAAVTILALSACGGDDALDADSGKPAASDTIVIGSANFAESTLLAEIYAGALEAKGVKVEKKLNIGSREVYMKALEDGSIDLLPEYNGYLLAYYDEDTEAITKEEVAAELTTKLPAEFATLEPSPAENSDTLTVTKATADKYNLKSIGDLAPVAKDLVVGGPGEWKIRKTGLPGFKEKYGVTFKEFKVLDAGGPLTTAALENGQIQAANIFATDPNLIAKGWVALEDPNRVFLAANIMPVITKSKVTPTVTEALNAVSAKLSTQLLLDMDKKVITDKADPQTVAKEFLTSNGLA
jgi:osmoprotectant transport system substrate-binding protein